VHAPLGEGRFGLNLLCGWNEGKFEMFGATLRDHEALYEYAQEWLDIVKLARSPQLDFNFDRHFFKLKGARANPKPYGGTRPAIMKPARRRLAKTFAIRNCDALFSTIARANLAGPAPKTELILFHKRITYWRPLPDSNRCCRRERGLSDRLMDSSERA
jgi:alkanesulfonate monooxygenase SsuD/methylene tetrahydromethanopterin reductase-like flavin-dependent oxidoreductase (luciferase family)